MAVTRGPGSGSSAAVAARLPGGPLVQACQARRLSVVQLAARAGVDRSGLQRSLRLGLTPGLADRVAVRGLGVHPIEVWGDLWLLPEDLARARFAGRVHELFARMKKDA